MTLNILEVSELAFRALPISRSVIVVQELNPWFLFTGSTAMYLIVNSLVAYECALFSEAKHDKLRRDFQSRPGMDAFTGYEGNREQRLLYDKDGKVVREQSLQRDRFMASPTLWLWFPTITIATNVNLREKFLTKVHRLGYLPKFTSEVLKRTRYSQCGLTTILPGLATWAEDMFLKSYPQFVGTVADSSFLKTDDGLEQFVDQMIYIHDHSGNYLSFVDATKSTAPPLQSGNQTTFGSLVVDFDANNMNVYVNLANSYRSGQPDRSHIFDCVLLAPLTNDANYNSSVRYSHDGYSIAIPSLDRLCNYLVRRVLGHSVVDTTTTASEGPTTSDSPRRPSATPSVRTRSTTPLRGTSGKRVWLTPSDYAIFRRLSRVFRM